MKTKTYHISNFGNFRPRVAADTQGYVTVHDSPRYGAATDEQLGEWLESPMAAVRHAAATEVAERSLNEWRAS